MYATDPPRSSAMPGYVFAWFLAFNCRDRDTFHMVVQA